MTPAAIPAEGPAFPNAPGVAPDRKAASQVLRREMLEQDLCLKEAAHRIARSIGTVKRALNGSMGKRTAYRILKEFGDRGNAPVSRPDIEPN
jgi:hypothetical protein